MPKLTDKQRAFAVEYVKNGFCGEQAAIAAGYSARSADSQASRLKRKPQVKAFLDQLGAQIQEKSSVEVSEIIMALRKIAFSPVSERVSNADKLKALELLGKTLALFTDKQLISGSESAGNAIDPDELAMMKKAASDYLRECSRQNLKLVASEIPEGA